MSFLFLGLTIKIHCCFGIANAFERNGEISRMSLLSHVEKSRSKRYKACSVVVPEVGLEPTRYRYQRILSPSRLPIPSFRPVIQIVAQRSGNCKRKGAPALRTRACHRRADRSACPHLAASNGAWAEFNKKRNKESFVPFRHGTR